MPAHFGLDIGFSSVKVLQVKKEGSKFRVQASGIAPTPVPLESTAANDRAELVKTIKELIKVSGVKAKDVVVALPESQITSRIIELPFLTRTELASAIEFEAEQYIPLPLSEVELSWEVLTPEEKKEKEILVLLVAARKTTIEDLLQLLEEVGLNPRAVETELVATARILSLNNPQGNFMIVDLGRKTTDIAIVNDGRLAFIYTSTTGGDAFTRAIAAELGLEFTKAEEYKRGYGLSPQVLEGKVSQALIPVFQVLINTMRRALTGYQQKSGQTAKTIFLCGGAAKMPGVTSFLTKNLGLEIIISDPFQNFVKDEKFPRELQELSCVFNTVTGLALRDI